MTHQGRVHKISGKVEEISKRIIKSIPKEKIVYGEGLRRPLWNKIEFQDTAKERNYLSEIATQYNTQVSSKNRLVAHGTEDCSTLCQILLDGKLKHIKGVENYGSLGAYGENIQVGGYWDRGWGLFVATPNIITESKANSENNEFLTVPLQELKSILLPSPIVEVVKREFPEQLNLLKSYREFANEIKFYFQG
jgi:hypothetical protein